VRRLIVIAGPTASGKTAISIELAKRLTTEVISADSRQFYRELTIGTAKPTVEEMGGITHHFINSHSIHHPLSAGQYEKEALVLLESLYLRHETVVCVGGSGMFLKALTHGTHQFPNSKEIQEQLNTELSINGLPFLVNKLKTLDPETHARIDLDNSYRVIRALEIGMITGEKLSSLQKQIPKEVRNFSVHYFILDHPREILYERINQRVDQMFDNGLIKEAESVYPLRHLKSLQTVGYQELFTHFDGGYSLDEAKRLIKRNTRRYAKRQLTWFRSIDNAVWVQPPFDVKDFIL
jgi:tRNA dimethylallyltransferase